ncbi:unnamed protein product [Arabidopsis halleri]
MATNKNKESCTLTVEQSWLNGVDHTNSFYPYGTNHSLIFHTSSLLDYSLFSTTKGKVAGKLISCPISHSFSGPMN